MTTYEWFDFTIKLVALALYIRTIQNAERKDK